jgi:hypothetical protein
MSKKTETKQNPKQSLETQKILALKGLPLILNTTEIHKLNIDFYQPEYCFNIG